MTIVNYISVIYFFILLYTTACLKKLSGQEKEEEVPAGWWKIPKTNGRITIGGYVKFDLIRDFNPINSPSFFDVSKIPTDGSEGIGSQSTLRRIAMITWNQFPEWGIRQVSGITGLHCFHAGIGQLRYRGQCQYTTWLGYKKCFIWCSECCLAVSSISICRG